MIEAARVNMILSKILLGWHSVQDHRFVLLDISPFTIRKVVEHQENIQSDSV
jgi:hypothetical protein